MLALQWHLESSGLEGCVCWTWACGQSPDPALWGLPCCLAFTQRCVSSLCVRVWAPSGRCCCSRTVGRITGYSLELTKLCKPAHQNLLECPGRGHSTGTELLFCGWRVLAASLSGAGKTPGLKPWRVGSPDLGEQGQGKVASCICLLLREHFQHRSAWAGEWHQVLLQDGRKDGRWLRTVLRRQGCADPAGDVLRY